MKNQSPIVSENNPVCSSLLIHFGFTKMSFKDWLRAQLDARQMRAADLSRRSGVTPQNLSRILTDKPHPITGALPKVTIETVDRIAKALGAPLGEARHAAGFASDDPDDMHDLEGVRIAFLPGQKFTDADKDEILKTIRRQLAGMKAEKENDNMD
jgi:transcriptional regulator with XRE-family HTH domain